ncbi:mannose-6-phosphate isomerase, class I [Thermodesulfobacteriota bacterium]
MNKICLLKNPVQEYAWGSKSFIPQLLGRDPANPSKPQAELWMGAHEKAPSQVFYDGSWSPLTDLISRNTRDLLGVVAEEKFAGKFPFLFKVLAIEKPLSIQVHPNLAQATEGFARENQLGIPLDAGNRSYKDENHKPEVICALRPFWALKGFRPVKDILRLLDQFTGPALKDERNMLESDSDQSGLGAFFKALMTMNKDHQINTVKETISNCGKSRPAGPLVEWIARLNEEYPGDIGVISPLLLNLVQLQPGEALYLPAGEPHAYLKGECIELMANSDNVLRGGLTPKHIDVDELLKVIQFQGRELERISPIEGGDGETIYPAPAEDFILSVIILGEGRTFISHEDRSVEIMICMEGSGRIIDSTSGESTAFSRGTSWIVPAALKQYRIEGEGTIYKAAVPLNR